MPHHSNNTHDRRFAHPDQAMHQRRNRNLIAQAAAKLIADEGENNYQRACQKAAYSLGFGKITDLPSRVEVESAVREYQQLFQADVQPIIVRELRMAALAYMQEFKRFNPKLVGAVAEGVATTYSPIEFEIECEDLKEFNFFLLNHGLAYRLLTNPQKPTRQIYELQSLAPPLVIIAYEKCIATRSHLAMNLAALAQLLAD